MMELYPGYLEDHFNIHKLRCVLPLISPGFLPSDYCEFINIMATVALAHCLK
jgi:hypothetical protein